MITFFTVPKPFAGHIGVIQHNALESWRRLDPAPRLILLGDEAGVAAAARRHEADHIPELARNEFGTPLLHDAFARAQARSDHHFFCYINTDILLMSDFGAAFARIARRKRRFLMVGQRWDADIREAIGFEHSWEADLRQQLAANAKQHRPTGIDYFLFSRGLLDPIPPFAIGRFAWDNWMIFRARQFKAPVVDASRVVMAVHQNHDYAHAGGFKQASTGSEARHNLRLAGGNKCLFTIWDSTHILDDQRLLVRDATTGLGGGIWSYRRSAAGV